MAKSKANNGKEKNKSGININLKVVVQMLQKSLLLVGKYSSSRSNNSSWVKEGHFAVIAAEEEELKRFIVPLDYLRHPTFTRLLEKAAEEYGFDREGALMVPCPPCVLERMLAEELSINHSSTTMLRTC